MKINSIASLLMIGTTCVNAATEVKPEQDKPTRCYRFSARQNIASVDDENVDCTWMPTSDQISMKDHRTFDYSHKWADATGGKNSSHWVQKEDYENWDYLGINGWWQVDTLYDITEPLPPEVNIWRYTQVQTDSSGLNALYQQTSTLASRPIWDESCDVVDPYNESDSGLISLYEWEDHSIDETYTRSAQTRWHLQTGGKATPRRNNLFVISGGAAEVLDLRAHWPWGAYSPDSAFPIDPTDVMILGKLLDTNGILYKVLPDGAELDVTPEVHGVDFYTFGVGAQKYHCQFTAYVLMPDPPPGHNTHNGLTDWGHAWWCLSSDAPVEAFNQFPPTNRFHFVNEQVGYADSGWPYGHNGILRDPETDSNPTTSKTYDIGFDGLLSGLSYTQGIKDNPGIYSVTGNNCVQHVVAAGAAAGLALPADTKPETFGWDLINSQ